jgi:hypothetical protein
MKMNAQYFIKKFEAIPDEMWTTGKLTDRNTGARCAQGHCIVGPMKDFCWTRGQLHKSKELIALNGLFHMIAPDPHKKPYRHDGSITTCYSLYVNNGMDLRYQQRGPKQRILAALHDIKDLLIKRQVEKAKQRVPTVEQVLEHDPSVKINYKGEWIDAI